MPDRMVQHLRQMLDIPEIAVQGGLIQEWLGPLFPEEQDYMARCVPKRRAEFTAGRTAARAALRELGVQDQGIAAKANRAPKWPDGLTGSITHDPSHCFAAVAHRRYVRGIGIDIEPRRCMSTAMRDLFLSAKDQSSFSDLCPLDPEIMPVTVFSAKESVFKALNPLTDRLHNPHDFYIQLSPQPGVFTAHIAHDDTALGIVGRYVMDRDVVMTCAALPVL